jgi:hypothetical protein
MQEGGSDSDSQAMHGRRSVADQMDVLGGLELEKKTPKGSQKSR